LTRCGPRPGAQLRFTDLDGDRFTAFATDARKGQLPDLGLRNHRRVHPQQCSALAKQQTFPSPQVVLSYSSTGTMAASDAHPGQQSLPSGTDHRTPRSGTSNPQASGPGAAPAPAVTIDAFCAPHAEGLNDCASKLFTAPEASYAG
jgi:hypothetical protein